MTLNALYDPWNAGIPAMPSVDPHQLMTLTSRKMNFKERLQSFIAYVMTGMPFGFPLIFSQTSPWKVGLFHIAKAYCKTRHTFIHLRRYGMAEIERSSLPSKNFPHISMDLLQIGALVLLGRLFEASCGDIITPNQF